MLIVDLRRPVHLGEFRRRLRRMPLDRVYALTPLADWLLEQEGVPFETDARLVDPDRFKAECLRNDSRLHEVFREVFGADQESWLGLTYELKLILDYALIEETRWRLLEENAGHVLCDIAQASRSSLAPDDHYLNRASLYFWGVAQERFVQVPRVSECLSQWALRLRRTTAAGLRRRILRRLPAGRRPVLVTQYPYDWEAYRPALEKQFQAMTTAQLAGEALAAGPAAPAESERQRTSLRKALEARYAGVIPRTLPHVLRMTDRQARRYAELRSALSHSLRTIAKRHGIRASLNAMASTHDEFLVNYYLKANGYPTLFHQHGGYMSEALFIHDAEIVPASHNFVYGEADADLFQRLRPGQPVFQVGSSALSRIASGPERPGRFLYVLLHHLGNANSVNSRIASALPDNTSLFRRHCRVIDLFGRHPEVRLYLREHPGQSSHFLYAPLREYVRQRRLRNVFLDRSAGSSSQYLSGYECVIMDYVSTSILHALAMRLSLVCHTGSPCRITPQAERLLERAAACADTDAAFAALLEHRLVHGPRGTDDGARERFLVLYGGSADPADPQARPHLERLLRQSLDR